MAWPLLVPPVSFHAVQFLKRPQWPATHRGSLSPQGLCTCHTGGLQ